MRQSIHDSAEEISGSVDRGIRMRAPLATDGSQVHELIARCEPLDRNSLYCNLLQCTDFADTSILAERNGNIVGWISAYRLPDDSSMLFIWQVAVAPEARGTGLGRSMVLSLLDRVSATGVDRLRTTITADNKASMALFSAVARALNAPKNCQPWFDEDSHFDGGHESEYMISIGPFSKSPNATH